MATEQTNKDGVEELPSVFPAVWRPCWTPCCLQVCGRNKHVSWSRQPTRLRAGSKQLLGRELQMRRSNWQLLQPTVMPVLMEPTLLPSRHKPWLLPSEAQLPPWPGTKAAVDCGVVPTLRTSKMWIWLESSHCRDSYKRTLPHLLRVWNLGPRLHPCSLLERVMSENKMGQPSKKMCVRAHTHTH